jgi:AbrB family looped-hinge helix DNA binding protein
MQTLEAKAVPKAKVNSKFQLTIPDKLRAKARIKAGDVLDVVLENQNLVFKTKAVTEKEKIDAKIAAGLKAYEEGRVTPAFNSMKEYHEYKLKNKK